jgi:hypothetical protein
MAFAFEKLQVYQKAVAFADAVCTLTKSFPGGYFFLADQLNRAALSIRGEEDDERRSRYWEMFDICDGKQTFLLRIMGEIDEVIEAHGGWPDAFITDPEEIEKLKSGKE